MRLVKGNVESIAASGRIWAGYEAQDIKTLFFESLRSARKSIQMSIFSLGEDNDEMKEFFEIIESKLEAEKNVQFVVNNINGDTVGKYSQVMLHKLMKYPNFELYDFKPQKTTDLLHAKIAVIDRKFALIGSANVSRNALFANYEIMLKISGSATGTVSNLLDRLISSIKEGEQF